MYESHIYNCNLKYGDPTLNQIQRSGHNEESEIKILIWLHNHNYIDATLCTISNTVEYISIDCSIIYPKMESINIILKYYSKCYLTNYNNDVVLNIIRSNKSLCFDNSNSVLYIDK